MKRHHRRATAVLAITAGLALSWSSASSAAAPPPHQNTAGFGDARLHADVVRGPVRLAARRAWVWRIPESSGPETIRVILDVDVDTVLGTSRLTARRASLWIRPRRSDAGGARVYEIFGYYSNVSSSGGPFVLTAESLPVEAVLAATEPLRLKVDLRLPGPPEAGTPVADFVAESDRAFAEAKDRILHPDKRIEQAEPPLQPPAWLLERLRGGGPTPDEPMPGAGGEPEPAPGADASSPSAPQHPTPGRPIPFSPKTGPGSPPAPSTPPPPPPEQPAAQPPPDTGRPAPTVPPPEPSPGPSITRQDAATPGPASPEATPEEATGVEPGQTNAGSVTDRIFSSRGVFFFSAGDRVTVQRGDDANAITLTGGVVLQYEGVGTVMEMTARRAVIFLDPGPLSDSIGRFDVADVRGVYLEGGVRVTDGDYTLRSPRVYYDVRADRAILLDAVFRTYDDRHRMPLYMRAKVIRQEAANRFSAEKSTYANSAFATPHLAIGTSKMTITRRTDPGGDTSNIVDAHDITIRGGGVPFFWWPRLKGDPERFPLRSIGLTDSNRTGTVFRTSWDPFTLLGIKRPDGLGADVNLDYYADRGFGFGTGLDWNTATMSGGLFASMLPEDTGTDVLRNGVKVARDGEFRGVAALKHRWKFRPDWTLWLNGFTASDESIMPALFRRMGEDSEELTNRVYLRRLKGNSLLTIEAKAAATDFVPNDNIAQAPGYMVDKLPEISVGRIGDDLLDRWAPGRLTHTWNATLSRIRFRLPEITPRDLGLNRSSRSQRGFGLEPDVTIGDGFRAAGLDESFVTRLDTRHELSTTFDVGPVHVNPFIVGRATAYDSRFENFSPGESDRLRLWGSAGVNLTTSIYRIDDSVSSTIFDLNRMRHIIEPGVTLWHAGSTIDEADLPVFDDDVESLAQGTGIRVGVNQTWQTKRGAPGRWRTVDVFTLDMEYVWFSGDTNRSTPIGRFYASRPELSAPDEFVRVAGTWQVTEVLGLAGETIWDADTQREDRNSLGMILRHSEDLTTRFELRRLEAQNDTFGSGSLRGTFGDKYVYSLVGTYNFRLDDFQRFTLSLLRRFPNGLFGGRVTYNNISGETTLGIYIQPNGLPGAGLSGGGSGSRF